MTDYDSTETVKGQVEQFLNDTMDARSLQERDRDYYDHKQWTAQQEAKLRSRNQAPIVVNRIKPKVEGLIGLYNLRTVDPKAYARTKKHEKASHAITDALRFVADNNDFNSVKQDVAEEFWVEGYSGAVVDVKQKKSGDIEIRVEHVPWDRIYFDPHSRRRDFSDARFKGFMLWMDGDQIKEFFPDVELGDLCGEYRDETFEDRPKWYDKKRDRYRLAYHFWIKEGVWWYCIFSGDAFLVEPKESPFLDDEGEPACIIELVCANIDRDNQRYGEVRGYISMQDEINHRRSKALHLLSQRQTFGRKGEVKDVENIKRELAKPDGHVEFIGEQFGKDFGVLPTNDMAQGQFDFYQDAKAELDAVGLNAQLAGQRQSGDLSGKAIDRLQQAGTLELNRQFSLLTAWEKRIYRQIWARVKQFWTEEKWIRVTDDQDSLRWVGLNSQVTAQEWMVDIINDESQPLPKRKQAAASFQFLMQALDNPMTAASAQQALDQPVDIQNPVPELDVDIILDQSFDVINRDEEQFKILAQFGQSSDIDIIELIELSQIRGKDELIEKIEKRRAAQAEAQGNLQKIAAYDAEAKAQKTMSEVQLNAEKSMQTRIENQILATRPPDVRPQVAT